MNVLFRAGPWAKHLQVYPVLVCSTRLVGGVEELLGHPLLDGVLHIPATVQRHVELPCCLISRYGSASAAEPRRWSDHAEAWG